MCVIANSTTSCTVRVSWRVTVKSGFAPMCALSSSASVRNSAMSTPHSPTFRTIPASDIAGAMRMKFNVAHRIRTVYRTLAMKIVLLALVFLLIPLILYRLFESADAQQSRLLQRTVEEKGTLIASVLQPRLAGFQGESPDQLQHALDELVAEGGNIKVLVRYDDRPGGGFLYIASAPAVSADYLEQERAELIKLGIFDRLAPTCDGSALPSVRFTNPAGRPELLTSVTPVHIGKSCWGVITAQAVEAILGPSLGEPGWRRPPVRI